MFTNKSPFVLSIECENWQEAIIAHPFPRFKIKIWIYILILIIAGLALSITTDWFWNTLLLILVYAEVLYLMQLDTAVEGYEKCMESLVKQILKNQKCPPNK